MQRFTKSKYWISKLVLLQGAWNCAALLLSCSQYDSKPTPIPKYRRPKYTPILHHISTDSRVVAKVVEYVLSYGQWI